MDNRVRALFGYTKDPDAVAEVQQALDDARNSLGVAPYRAPILVRVPVARQRWHLWRRFRAWWRGIGYRAEAEVKDDRVRITVHTPGSKPNIYQDADWGLLKLLCDLLDQTSDDGSPVILRWVETTGHVVGPPTETKHTTFFPGACVPKLRRALHPILEAWELSQEVQRKKEPTPKW